MSSFGLYVWEHYANGQNEDKWFPDSAWEYVSQTYGREPTRATASMVDVQVTRVFLKEEATDEYILIQEWQQ